MVIWWVFSSMTSLSQSEVVGRGKGGGAPRIKNPFISLRFKIVAGTATVISTPLSIFILNETFQSKVCCAYLITSMKCGWLIEQITIITKRLLLDLVIMCQWYWSLKNMCMRPLTEQTQQNWAHVYSLPQTCQIIFSLYQFSSDGKTCWSA